MGNHDLRAELAEQTRRLTRILERAARDDPEWRDDGKAPGSDTPRTLRERLAAGLRRALG